LGRSERSAAIKPLVWPGMVRPSNSLIQPWRAGFLTQFFA
jgi:hypothetical protein